MESREEFETIYRTCCVSNFANYYCSAKENSKTSAKDYILFCDHVGLKYKEEWPAEGLVNRSKIELSLKTKEGVYDFTKFKNLVEDRIKKTSTLKIKLNHRVLSGSIKAGGEKNLITQNKTTHNAHTFDFIINAMYANHNQFCVICHPMQISTDKNLEKS